MTARPLMHPPEDRIRVPLLRQEWHRVTFLHWRVDPVTLADRLPPGLTVDTHEGAAWVTVTALEMARVRIVGAPPIPGLSTFAATNLRTYVQGPDGRPGLWFFSLEAGRRWITIGGRLLLGAPYFRARASVTTDGGLVSYTGRRPGSDVGYAIDARPGEPKAPDVRDAWLTARWCAYTLHADALIRIPVRHRPWPLHVVTVPRLEENLRAAAGLPAAVTPDLAHYSDGVDDVVFGAARPVRRSPAASPSLLTAPPPPARGTRSGSAGRSG